MSDDNGLCIKAAVIGAPISHSRSPLIHGFWLKHHGIYGQYDRIHVEPGGLASFIAGLRREGLAGCNVTLPHKQAVLELVDESDALSRFLGSANTLYFEGDKLCAMTTDGTGFMENLFSQSDDWQAEGKNILILGAGGAAAPIIHALIHAGADKVIIANRTKAKAEILADKFGDRALAIDWSQIAGHLGSTDLLVNTTSLGMTGQPVLDLDISDLPAQGVVADIVYAPLETDLLKAARKRGLATVDGLGMLLHQAVPGFEKWFGVRPQVTPALRAVVIADLQ